MNNPSHPLQALEVINSTFNHRLITQSASLSAAERPFYDCLMCYDNNMNYWYCSPIYSKDQVQFSFAVMLLYVFYFLVIYYFFLILHCGSVELEMTCLLHVLCFLCAAAKM